MSKAVVSGLLTTAFLIIFVVINPTVQKRQKNPHLARRLGHNRAAFDPLVEEIEEKVMQASDHRSFFSSLNIFLNDVHDQYEFVSQVKNLNITMRLMVLFPLLDLEPRDGFVSLKELEHWNLQQAIHRLNYRTHKELASLDQNEDGSITLKEYLSKISYKDGEVGRWEDRFNTADCDNNGALSFEEFRDFLHPEDSDNEVVKKWISKERIRRFDHDGDGKLSYIEFRDEAFDLYKTYAEFENSVVIVIGPEEKFAQLDANEDGYLDEKEMEPIQHYLHPGESAYATFYTNYLIHEADENRDGVLSLTEMINNDYLFYNTVDEGLDEGVHDEF